MGKMQRNKGANFEREIANEFKAAGITARRGGASQSFSANLDPDVVLEDLPGLWIECKRGEKTYPLKALKQAKMACSNNTPVSICRDDQEKSIVTMELGFFLDLLCMAYPDIVKPQELETSKQETPARDLGSPQENTVDGQLGLFGDPKDP